MTSTTSNDKSSTDYYNLGLDMRNKGELEKAIEFFKQALSLKCNDAWVHFDLANVLMLQEKYSKAVTSYQKAIELSGNRTNGLFYMRLGEAYANQGLLDEAVENYQNALSVDTFNLKATVLSRLADIFVGLKKYDEALNAYEQAINISHDCRQPLVMFKLGDLAYYQGDQLKAFDYYEQAININSAASKPIFYLKPGEILAENNQLDLAVLFYRSMLKIKPESYQAIYALAMLRFKLGEYEEAIFLVLNALEINPSFVQAQRGLTQICNALGWKDIADSINYGTLPFKLIQKYFLKVEDDQALFINDINKSNDVSINKVFDGKYITFSSSKTVTDSIHPKFLAEEAYNNECYWTLCNQCSLEHYYYIGNASTTSQELLSPVGAEDFSVDSLELLKLLATAGL